MAENIEEAEDFLLDDEDVSNENKYLLSRLGEEVYGINIADVTEIIEMQRITDVPDMPEYVKGVINLRGKVIPVIDLRLKFGMEAQEVTRETCIIMVQVEKAHTSLIIGIMVDAVSEVLNIAENQIEAAPSLGTQVDTRFILGMAKTKNAVKILLDIDQVLSPQEMNTLQQTN